MTRLLSKLRSGVGISRPVVFAIAAWLACVFFTPYAQAQRKSLADVTRSLYESDPTPSRPSMRFAPSREGGPDYHVKRMNESTLVVYRARAGNDGLEGFLVDLPALLATLHERVLTDRGLAAIATLSLPRTSSKQAHAFAFDYTFQEPFTALQATLSLGPLDLEDEETLLLWLAGFLGAVILGGLFALYRMVAVQVEFSERRSNFVSAVSHELKTPLTAIRMYGEILREGLVDDEQKRTEYYGLITSESERLSRLVNNVLELANIERGVKSRQTQRADPTGSIREAVHVMQGQAQQQGFVLALSMEEKLSEVEHDPDGVKQVLFNLLDNALKYGRESAIKRIEVSCRKVGRDVQVCVRDHGPGVSPAHLSQLFEPFYRAENELTRRHAGIGLGLSLVQRIARDMGAQVRCRNAEPGFEVSLLLRG